jgi:hypothetical protein
MSESETVSDAMSARGHSLVELDGCQTGTRTESGPSALSSTTDNPNAGYEPLKRPVPPPARLLRKVHLMTTLDEKRDTAVATKSSGFRRELKLTDAAAFSIGLIGPVGGMALLGAFESARTADYCGV